MSTQKGITTKSYGSGVLLPRLPEAGYFFSWIRDWGVLVPSQISWSSRERNRDWNVNNYTEALITLAVHRLTTYPFINLGSFRFLCSLLALAPLLDRFELEYGTITTLALFTGPFNSLPGLLYLLLESGLLRGDASNQGSSVWVFLLLSAEVVKSNRANPSFHIGPYKIPTWTLPIPAIFTISFFAPQISLLGNLSGAVVGYLWGFGYIKFLAPPERILRFIESKLNLLGRLPHFVSTDKKTYGRYGVLDAMEDRPVALSQ